jgi:hypothetical protein
VSHPLFLPLLRLGTAELLADQDGIPVGFAPAGDVEQVADLSPQEDWRLLAQHAPHGRCSGGARFQRRDGRTITAVAIFPAWAWRWRVGP